MLVISRDAHSLSLYTSHYFEQNVEFDSGLSCLVFFIVMKYRELTVLGNFSKDSKPIDLTKR